MGDRRPMAAGQGSRQRRLHQSAAGPSRPRPPIASFSPPSPPLSPTLPPQTQTAATAHVDALVQTCRDVWAALGFFDASDGCESPAGALFLQVLRRFYKRLFANPSEAVHAVKSRDVEEDEEAEDDALLVRNGLWRVLSNAVFYCLTALDPRRLRATAAPPAETEVRTGGVEDQYEVVHNNNNNNSSGSGMMKEEGCEKEPNTASSMSYYTTPFVPVPLRWKDGGKPAKGQHLPRGHDDSLNDDAAEAAGVGQLARLHELLPTLSIADWYLCLRCLAQVGYRRDAFYTQSPSQACPHELALALLWLTKQYQLVAVVEYVELNARYNFLLQYHSECATGAGQNTAAADDEETASLLKAFGTASPWPPAGFNESAAVAERLAHIDALVTPPAAGDGDGATAGRETSSVVARRLMALQRLVSLSLNRLQHALEQRAEQASAMGLHCATDLQLCQRSHHTAYTRVISGLQHLADMPARVQARLDRLAECGLLVAQALHCSPPLIRASEVVAGLKEDDSTWLAAGSGDGTEAENLAAVLGRFRAARTKQYLVDRWKSTVRQQRTAPDDGSNDVSGDCDGSRQQTRRHTPFALDGSAQYREECRVHNNVIARYSLEAALAAEVAVLQFQQRQRQKQQQRPETTKTPSSPGAGTEKQRRPQKGSATAVTTLALLPLSLKTASVGAAGSCRAVQATEVGPPAPGSTTSARVEVARLRALREELAAPASHRRQEKVARCQQMLRQLLRVYGMRLAVGCLPAQALTDQQHLNTTTAR